ncbi:MAG: electron transfer flavoprotein subunit beta/FixA family protein [Candidatus Poseidoniia archaeon]|jgi:electron transfer flavoprotein beta subunit|nr:electron transfer flavoprotein subunit beta/FixA family protein [Candidatus Poseidoniia archaeon]MEE1544270.1 electron transfer flavoprotein subunit beta/FixA family protein [Alphaproteobacteria bacterium]MDP7256252.1 electron transfer flavoprotein subunit beta/FixA family protein [Candidatus Poseidoniia archaeon]MDP7473539.1 electron transfer flavoprotein subunit beta/FixA family protein [Candidatus Poseidoniia archaeon]MDP7538413.1 electron transfer flavoprotein subunit beta/FixA family pr|tara:strand:+ start:407 stop:1147 length:741 start_codon:yes stop_codon:yes gene_type:complete
MKIAVLLKMVPDLVEELEVDSTGKALDTEELKFKLNEFDDHALEEALLLGGEEDEVVALALEGEGNEKLLFTALAKGASRAVQLTGVQPGGSGEQATAFAAALAESSFDLILTGVQSVDDREGQLGPLLAARMGLPCVSVVTGVSVTDGGATVNKEYSGGVMAEFEVTLPAVLGIQSAQQPPRYAPVSKVRQMQQTATIESLTVGGAGGGAESEVTAMAPPEVGASAKMLDDAAALLEVLRGEGVA